MYWYGLVLVVHSLPTEKSQVQNSEYLLGIKTKCRDDWTQWVSWEKNKLRFRSLFTLSVLQWFSKFLFSGPFFVYRVQENAWSTRNSSGTYLAEGFSRYAVSTSFSFSYTHLAIHWMYLFHIFTKWYIYSEKKQHSNKSTHSTYFLLWLKLSIVGEN